MELGTKMVNALSTLMDLSPYSREFYGIITALNDRLNHNHHDFQEMVAGLLGRLEPEKKMLDTALRSAIMRLLPSNSFEAVAVRDNDVIPEIYLCLSTADDTDHPGEWHAPRSIYHPGERDGDVAKRLAQEEFGAPISEFHYVDKIRTNEKRGVVHSFMFKVKLGDKPRIDDRHKWFPVDELPGNTVIFHREPIIPTVLLAHHCYRVPQQRATASK